MYVCLCVSAFMRIGQLLLIHFDESLLQPITHPIMDFAKRAPQNKINNISKIAYKIEVGRLKFEEEKLNLMSFLLY